MKPYLMPGQLHSGTNPGIDIGFLPTNFRLKIPFSRGLMCEYSAHSVDDFLNSDERKRFAVQPSLQEQPYKTLNAAR